MSCRCGNVAAILELDENLNKQFRVFDAAPQVGIMLLKKKKLLRIFVRVKGMWKMLMVLGFDIFVRQ